MVAGALAETTFQWGHRRDSDLAKGIEPLQVNLAGWQGNFFTDRRGRHDRSHIAQTIAWEHVRGKITHRFKAGAEFDHVISDLAVDRRSFQLFNDAGMATAKVEFEGPNSASIRNREYGVFFQDRIAIGRKLQLEAGIRADRERIVGQTNLAPRTGFSFLPFGTDRSKISGGIGLFYDNVGLENLQLPEMQHRKTTFFRSDGSTAAALSATAVRVSAQMRNPVGVHWNISWEHEWAPRWVGTISYTQKRGRRQIRLAALPHESGFDLLADNSGSSRYDAIEFSMDRPIRTNLRILASYTYSEAKGRPSISLDFPDPALEFAGETPLLWNSRHRFVSWGYFPFVWSTNASFSVEARSGFPFTVIDEFSRTVGPHNGHQLPVFFVTNVSVEKEVPVIFGKRMAVRVGVTNLLNRFNPRFVDANIHSPNFMRFSESSGRAFVGRVRLIKK
jgi:outer membrane receptor protein involved in Fe transport